MWYAKSVSDATKIERMEHGILRWITLIVEKGAVNKLRRKCDSPQIGALDQPPIHVSRLATPGSSHTATRLCEALPIFSDAHFVC
jgi:hypothetical protein